MPVADRCATFRALRRPEPIRQCLREDVHDQDSDAFPVSRGSRVVFCRSRLRRRPSTGSRTARRPIRCGPISSPAPTCGPRTPARRSRPRSTTATSPRSRRRSARRSPPRPTRSSRPAPIPGSLVEVVKEARAAGIPVINFNTPDPKVNFNAYVGGDLAHRRQGLGAISRRQRAGEVRRLRLDAGRGARRELRRRGREGRSRRSSSRSTSPGK